VEVLNLSETGLGDEGAEGLEWDGWKVGGMDEIDRLGQDFVK
jgi:hypothetical protein